MQRVAIARALVNDPEILLADEPTGALDSETSVQVMDLLKEIAKDRLVIMVTHNPELAEEYATRTVRLLDGNIISDSAPYNSDSEAVASQSKKKKASMSALTAFSLSLSNLMTKKGRAIMTAFAGSIGIIGIALILSISTGINNYIDDNRIPGEYLTVTSQDAEVTDQDGTGYLKYSDTKKNGTVTYSFAVPRDGFACIHLNLPKRNDYYVSVNGTELYKETISLPQMIAVSDVAAGDVIDVRVVCKADENSTMTVGAAIVDMDVFRRGYEILNASTLKLTTFESTYVKGSIDCDRDGLLYASIPQNGNWKVKVDGKPAEIRLVGDCMVGVPVSSGQHVVEYTYRNEAFALGWKVSLLCAAVFGLLVWKNRKDVPQKKRGRFER